ncbi:butyrophilin-like protein 9 [Gracilinanus agilis]|uniref:butyrophilin-like protein 9 n=1 Tax=Gracilinanus agilis TaxID=191870 RepID=UPI001CFCC7A5|nr:butyrophilin-like protein 9 [Gracilinanus agilis]
MNPFFLLDLSFILLVLLPWSLSGEFVVLGPQQTVIALVDRDVTFSCHLSPQLDAQHMDVIFFHNQSSLVHQYRYEKDYLKYQHLDYQGRTEFLHEHISRGNVALLLHRVQPSDEGKYRCYFASPTYNNEAEFQVDVASTGTPPHLHIEGAGNKKVRLVCTSAGWYPEPEVQWRNHQEESLSQGTTINKKENGLFSVETSITVSANSKENVSCVIGNPRLSQKLEASVSLAEALFPNVIHRMEIWIGIIVFLSITFLVIVIIIIFKWQKIKKAKVCNEEEADVTPETGFWIICLDNSDTYQAFSSPWIQLQLSVAPKTVGNFLDYETDTISFYNATEATHIHTFHDSFKEALRPWTCPGSFN